MKRGEALILSLNTQSKAMADQMMAADKGRLKTKLGVLSRADMSAVEDAIKVQLGLPK
jgi:mRNA interferase MazF